MGGRPDYRHAADLEPADRLDGSGAGHVDARGGRFLRLGTRDPRAVLGSTRGMVDDVLFDRTAGKFFSSLHQLLGIFYSGAGTWSGRGASRRDSVSEMASRHAGYSDSDGGEPARRSGCGTLVQD